MEKNAKSKEPKKLYEMLVVVTFEAKDNDEASGLARAIGGRIAETSTNVDGWRLMDAEGEDICEVDFA